MTPYVRKSFWKHFKNGLSYIELSLDTLLSVDEEKIYKLLASDLSDKSIDSDIFKHFTHAYQYAMDMTVKEVGQAVEAMFHNLNTLQSRSGNQLPFTSINTGTCTLPEGRLITKAILEGCIKGVGKLHRTSVFPCVIFQCMKGVNRKEGDPNYDLFRLALKSTSLRLYPNYCNVDWSGNEGYDIDNPKTYFSTIDKLVA
jgi:ribonucleoside-triphosphate reductase